MALKQNSVTLGLVGLLTSLYLFSACDNSLQHMAAFDYGTESDSARYYFLKGWEEILDNGRWTASEAAFRKAITFDPDWLLGKSLVGRISHDTEEKQVILQDIQLGLHEAGPDERLLIEVNLLSIGASINRDRGIPNTPEFNQRRREQAEQSFGAFARKYPQDDYFKAEYIEFLHANHGAQVALDSISVLANSKQKKLPFYISYAAMMHLELNQPDEATVLLDSLKNTSTNEALPATLVLEAQILESKGQLAEAEKLINRVVASDSNHLIAVGLQARIEQALSGL